MAKNKDRGGGGGEGAVGRGSRGQQPVTRPTSRTARLDSAGWPARLRQGSERETHTHTQEGEGQAGTAGEGGLPTSDPADGGHMAAASQIKRLRLGGSAITAV